MTEWAPATEAEAAMRDALRAGDQELYFRILARTELLLPVSSDAVGGRAAMGWGTWTWGQRTHVLGFTSPEAMYACLTEHPGSARKVPYHELAGSWPNLEWWLAVNPGLPIEGYLPAWFVSQLARGDLRLPGRTMGQRARLERARAESLARASATVPGHAEPRALPAADRSATGRATSGATAGTDGTAADLVRADLVRADLLGADVASSDRVSPGLSSGLATADPAGAGRSTAPPQAPTSAPYTAPGDYGAPDDHGAPDDYGVPDDYAMPGDGEPGDRPAAAGEPGTTAAAPFRPANDVETELLDASTAGDTDAYLSTLLLAKVLLPVADGADPALRPGADGFVWRTETIDDQLYVVVFTSPERLTGHLSLPAAGGPEAEPGATAGATASADTVPTIGIRFVQLIRAWPDESWSFAVNPGTPVGATLPGTQITALATWAAEVGLGDDAGEAGESSGAAEQRGATTRPAASRPTDMQKAVAPSQVSWYLERGYDRVSGFVQRAHEVLHLGTPAKLVTGLGLSYAGSPFDPDADEVYVLRWRAYRPSLYRIPYGGQTEAGMKAMEGWVIERTPFRGNGFAPGDSGDVIAEFKVDSARLPHGAQLWRLRKDGESQLVATLDADGPTWQQVEES